MTRIAGIPDEQVLLLESVESFLALNAEIEALNETKAEVLDRVRGAKFDPKAFKRLVKYLEDPAAAEEAEDNMRTLLLGFNEAKAARDGNGKVGTRNATRAGARGGAAADPTGQAKSAAPASSPPPTHPTPADGNDLPNLDRTKLEAPPARRSLPAALGKYVNGGTYP